VKLGGLAKIPIEVVEWPGGNRSHIQAEIDQPTFRAIAKGQKSVPLDSLSPAVPRVLPYCSILELRNSARDESLFVPTGPARLAKNWGFPVLAFWNKEDPGMSIDRAFELAGYYQETLGFTSLLIN
jgi:hypothetical protein